MAEAAKLRKKKVQFATVGEDSRQETLDECVSPNTRKATDVWLNCINAYLVKKGIANTITEVTTKDLPEVLFQFYSEVRTVKSETYKNTTLKCLRSGINRFMKETRSINIVSDPRFIRCNELFKCVQKQGKKQGKGTVQHKDVIESQDLERLNDYFSRYMTPSATILQRFVMFNIMFYMCRRGQENFAEMTVDTFHVSVFQSHLKNLPVCINKSQNCEDHITQKHCQLVFSRLKGMQMEDCMWNRKKMKQTRTMEKSTLNAQMKAECMKNEA